MDDLRDSHPSDDSAPVFSLTAQVVLGSSAIVNDDSQRLMLDILSSCGFAGHVEIAPAHRGGSAELAWIVLAALPLQAFLSALGRQVAEDSYPKLRTLLHKLAEPQGTSDDAPATERSAVHVPVPLVLMDSDTGLRIALEAELPGEAYRQLFTLDLRQFRVGPIHYDQALGRWRSELDEASSANRLPDGG